MRRLKGGGAAALQGGVAAAPRRAITVMQRAREPVNALARILDRQEAGVRHRAAVAFLLVALWSASATAGATAAGEVEWTFPSGG